MNIDPYSRDEAHFEEPPRGFWATLRHLGPGMILVGSVVGSGELIVTTKLGAVAGFVLLWFVILSCLIKVVVQAELTRHTISSGKTFLTVFNSLPGPAAVRPSWLNLPWLASVTAISVIAVAIFVQLPESQQNSLTGSGTFTVALLLAIASAFVCRHARPLAGKEEARRPTINWFTWLWLGSLLLTFVNSGAILGGAGQALELAFPDVLPYGARSWSIVVALATALLLLSGTYASLELTFIIMVATFTLMTLISTVLVQFTGYAVSWSDIERGLSFQTPGVINTTVILAALAMYAGTGVAYGEMKTYTYWCVEKGYARNVGANRDDEQWARRAKGWIRVMYTDVLITMVVYTVSTVCFYLLGAAILYAKDLNPDGSQTLSTLAVMYTESLGNWAALLFTIGAFFVLFSTVVAGSAGSSRLLADGLTVIGIADPQDYQSRLRFIRIFILVSLGLFTIAFWLFKNPPQMLLVTSSLIAALMYPIIGFGVLYLRHKDVDPRIVPGPIITGVLWVSAIALILISPVGILLAMAINFGFVKFS